MNTQLELKDQRKGGKLWELNQDQKEKRNQQENQTDANEIIKKRQGIPHRLNHTNIRKEINISNLCKEKGRMTNKDFVMGSYPIVLR